jgi:hypothetical protein
MMRKSVFVKDIIRNWHRIVDAPVVIRLDYHRSCAPIAQRLERFTSHQKVPKKL